MKNIRSSYYRVLNLGVDRSGPSDRNLKIKILNAFASISIVIMLIATCLVISISVKDAHATGTSADLSVSRIIFNRKFFTFILFDSLSVVVCFLVLFLNYKRKHTLHHKGEAGESKDGMDLTVCVIDNEQMKLQFAGANNPMYLVRKSGLPSPGDYKNTESPEATLYEIKGDKMPVSAGYPMNNYTMHEIDFCKGDMIYLFSDGYADQFGGPNGKKYGYRNFKQLLLNNSQINLDDQMAELEKSFNEWKGSLSQVDDVMVVGIRL